MDDFINNLDSGYTNAVSSQKDDDIKWFLDIQNKAKKANRFTNEIKLDERQLSTNKDQLKQAKPEITRKDSGRAAVIKSITEEENAAAQPDVGFTAIDDAALGLGKAVTSGTIEGINEFLETVGILMDGTANLGMKVLNPNQKDLIEVTTSQEAMKDVIPNPIQGDPQTIPEHITKSAAQYLPQMFAAFKALRAATNMKKGGAFVTSDFIANFSAFDGNEGRIVDMFEASHQPALVQPFLEFMQSNADDSEALGKFKNALEGSMVDAGIASSILGVAAMTKFFKHTKDAGTEYTKKLQKSLLERDPDANFAPLVPEVESDKIVKGKGPMSYHINVDMGNNEYVSLNPQKMDSKSVETVLDDIAKRSASDPIKDSEVDAMADLMGLNKEDVIEWQRANGISPERVRATYKIIDATAQQIEESAAMLTASGSDADRSRFIALLESFDIVYDKAYRVRAESGRVLRANRLLGKDRLTQIQEMNSIIAKRGGREKIDDTARLLLESGEKWRRGQILDKVRTNELDIALEVYKNSLLWDISTHTTNMIGNTMMIGLNLVEEGAGSIVGELRYAGLKKGLPPAEFQEARDLATGYRMGMNYGWLQAKKAFKDGADPLTKADVRHEAAFTAEGVSDTFTGKNVINPALQQLGMKDLQEDGFARLLVNGVGSFYRFGGYKTLGAEDAFFKGVNYYAKMYQIGNKAARQRGLRGEEGAAFIQNFINKPPKYAEAEAASFANKQTFTNPNVITGGVTRDLNKTTLGKSAQFMMPFVNTLSNIVAETWKRTPVGASIEFGQKAGTQEGDKAFARAMMSSMMMTQIWNLAESGVLVGNIDPNVYKRLGAKESLPDPYSVIVTRDDGTSYSVSYDRLEPWPGFLIGATADLHYAWPLLKEGDREELVRLLNQSFNDLVVDSTFAAGMVQSIVNATDGRDNKGNPITTMAATALVPRQVTRIQEIFVEKQIARKWDEALKARLPSFFDDVPVYRNNKGEPSAPYNSIEDDFGTKLVNLSTAFKIKELSNDPATIIQAKAGFYKPLTTQHFTPTIIAEAEHLRAVNEGKELTPDQIAEMPRESVSVPLTDKEMDRFEELINSKRYAVVDRLPAPFKKRLLNSDPNDTRKLLEDDADFKEAWADASIEARTQLWKEFPDIARRARLKIEFDRRHRLNQDIMR